MRPFRRATLSRFLLPLLAVAAACDDSPTDATPSLNTVEVTLPATTVQQGQVITATATGKDQNGTPYTLGPITWSTSSGAVATVAADGKVTAVAAGTTAVIATVDGRSGQKTLTITAPAGIKVNEVESNGGTPGDWIELFNPTAAAVDLTGWVIKDNDDTHVYTFPAGSTIAAGGYLVAEEAALGYGLGGADAARLYNPYGVLVDTYAWETHAAVTYGRCVNGTGAFTANGTSTKGAANHCTVIANVKVNEVESNGGTPGDWIELYNAGAAPADVSGYIVRDNDDTHTYALPAGTIIPAGGYYVVEEAALGFGLGGDDNARLFTPTGTLLDSYAWTAHAAVTYGRCAPNGTGSFVANATSSKGAANVCPAGPTIAAWPGSDDVITVDGTSVFQTNLSGLTYEGASGGNPAVLWAGRNGPGTIFRLIFSGGIWTPDPANGWANGKALRYPDGTGNPDTEGITYAAGGSAGGLYVSIERNNDASTISRNSILRFDPSGAGTTLTATNEWNLTADLPLVGANLGIEAITWVPDAFLTAQGFWDERASKAYTPADYADHGTGLFFVGVEGNGIVYVYALNHVTNVATRIATFTSTFPGVMGLEFDRELNYLWITCDDGCGNRSATFEIEQAAGATRGRWVLTHLFDKAPSMPNLNNEGFAIAPQSECVAGKKFVYWSDDAETGGHAIRRASLPCTRFP